MRLKGRDPHSPEVIREAKAFIKKMTREEALAFLYYRTPGVPESDMTGMYGLYKKDAKEPEKQEASAAS